MSLTFRVWTVVLALTLASLASCKKASEASNEKPGAEPAATDKHNQELGAKLNVYVACLNNLNPAVEDSKKRYLGWAPAAGLTGKETRVDGVDEVGRETTYGYECFKRDGGLDAIESKPPKEEALDKAGAAYKAAANKVLEVTATAAKYYKHGDYKDDGFAKGKEFHKPLMDAYVQFEKASNDLHAVMQQLQDKMTVEELAELEKTQGKKALWHHRNVMQKAELLLRAVADGGAPDVSKVNAAGDSFTKAWEEMKAWSDKNADEAKKNVHWGNFQRYSEELIVQLKEMNRAVKAGSKVPKSGDGSVQQFVAKYNQLVNLSNGMWN
jgi:hypothetical protein